jgi:hypothetical protein
MRLNTSNATQTQAMRLKHKQCDSNTSNATQTQAMRLKHKQCDSNTSNANTSNATQTQAMRLKHKQCKALEDIASGSHCCGQQHPCCSHALHCNRSQPTSLQFTQEGQLDARLCALWTLRCPHPMVVEDGPLACWSVMTSTLARDTCASLLLYQTHQTSRKLFSPCLGDRQPLFKSLYKRERGSVDAPTNTTAHVRAVPGSTIHHNR